MPKECNGLIDDINLSWEKSKRFGYYQQSNPKFIMMKLILEYSARKNCIGKLNKKQIMKLFGEPNKNEDRYFYYFMEKDCFSDKKEETAPYNCLFMAVEFDDKGMVVDIDRSFR